MAAESRSFCAGSMGPELSLAIILSFLKCSVTSRCFIEGERLLQVGHVILAGATERSADKVSVYGLCLQTSRRPPPCPNRREPLRRKGGRNVQRLFVRGRTVREVREVTVYSEAKDASESGERASIIASRSRTELCVPVIAACAHASSLASFSSNKFYSLTSL